MLYGTLCDTLGWHRDREASGEASLDCTVKNFYSGAATLLTMQMVPGSIPGKLQRAAADQDSDKTELDGQKV